MRARKSGLSLLGMMAVILLVASSALAIDAATLRNAVVKVTSNILGNSNVFKGSGLLFRHEGKTFVLTSDHVLFHVGSFVGEHYAIRKTPELKAKASFVVSEWGNGLGLLEVKTDEVPEALPDLLALKTSGPLAKGTPVDLYGYPWESTELTTDRGAVRDPASSQRFFVLQPRLVEIEDTVGEFGMSGGPVFTSKGEFAGVLSHQRIVAEEKNLVYLIPPDAVFSWLERYFKEGAAFRTVFHESPYYQGKSENLIGVENDEVTFHFERKAATSPWEVGILYLKDGVVPWFEIPTAPYADKNGWMKKMKAHASANPNKAWHVTLVSKSRPGKPVPFAGPTEFFLRLDSPDVTVEMAGPKPEP